MVEFLVVQGTECELFAEAEAAYDEETEKLEVRLDTSLRPCGFLPTTPVPGKPGWLPSPAVQVESVSLEESLPVAKDIFQSWVRRLRGLLAKNKTHVRAPIL